MRSSTQKRALWNPQDALHLWCAIFGVKALLGCGGVAEEEIDDWDTSVQAIHGGFNTNGMTIDYVVKVDDCSAVKFHDFKFLTAAHCFSGTPRVVEMTNNIDGGQGVQVYDVMSWERHPSYVLELATLGNLSHYDIGVLQLIDPTPAIPKIALGGVAPIVPGTGALMFGYGCDDFSNNDGRRQGGTFTVAPGSPTFSHIHNIRATGLPRTCDGDSGGPVVNGNPLRSIGVISSSNATDSYMARVANVIDWINDARPANHSSLFADMSPVFFVNTKAAPGGVVLGNCMAAKTNGASPPIDVVINECDGPFGLLSNAPPGWRLLASTTGAGHFKITNRFSGQCLGVAGNSTADNANIETQTCSTSGPTAAVTRAQSWRFQTSPRRIINVNSGRCIGTTGNSGLLNADVRQFTCSTSSSSDLAQAWLTIR